MPPAAALQGLHQEHLKNNATARSRSARSAGHNQLKSYTPRSCARNCGAIRAVARRTWRIGHDVVTSVQVLWRHR